MCVGFQAISRVPLNALSTTKRMHQGIHLFNAFESAFLAENPLDVSHNLLLHWNVASYSVFAANAGTYPVFSLPFSFVWGRGERFR